jgi:hypothetical protein
MKNKKSSKQYQVQHAAPKVIMLPYFKRHLNQVADDEESKLVRVFFATGNYRHPVQYMRLIRKRNTTNK